MPFDFGTEATWSEHFEFARSACGAGLNNIYTTAILDENVSGLRECARLLEFNEIMRCAQHRKATVAKGDSKGDAARYDKFARAPTTMIQLDLFNGFGSRLKDKINKVRWSEQSQASKNRDGFNECTGNIVEAKWNMYYPYRRANPAKALRLLVMGYVDRLRKAKEAAKVWPDNEVLTPHAKAELLKLRRVSTNLTSVQIHDSAKGIGSVKAVTDLSPIAVDVSLRWCAKCQTRLQCEHLVRMIDACQTTCSVTHEELFPYHRTTVCWKKLYEDVVPQTPDFSRLLESRSEFALKLKLGGGGRKKPGASKITRFKNALEMVKLRASSRRALGMADDSPTKGVSKQPSPTKPARPPAEEEKEEAAAAPVKRTLAMGDDERSKAGSLDRRPRTGGSQLTYLYSTSPGATTGDIVGITAAVEQMIGRLEASIYVTESDGHCGFRCLSFRLTEMGILDDAGDGAWGSGDMRALLGRAFNDHLDPLLAYHTRHALLNRAAKTQGLKDLRTRADEHKVFNVAGKNLAQRLWLKDIDLKCVAFEFGVNIYVVSVEAQNVSVMKYLWSKTAPGFVSIKIEEMGMASQTRGESVVNDDDIVLIYNGVHYNVLSWKLSEDSYDREEHEEAHFDGDFHDSEDGN